MQRERWLKIDESTDIRKVQRDVRMLTARWPDRYIYIVEQKRFPHDYFVLYIKHKPIA